MCAVMMAASPGLYAQNLSDKTPRLDSPGAHWYSRFTANYEPRNAPAVSVSNSSRADALVRAGKMYLSLNDAIALALENNIDVESQRYNFLISDSQYRSSLAGPGGAWDPQIGTSGQGFTWGHSSIISTNTQTNGGVAVGVTDTRNRPIQYQEGFAT